VSLAVVCLVASCSNEGSPTVVDGVEITADDVARLHVDFGDLDEDERAGSALLLILRQAFGAGAADELGVEVDETTVDRAYQERVDRFEGRGGVDVVLSSLNQTPERLRVEAELDTIRDGVSAELVRSEAPGFDINAAYDGYLLDEAEVCVRQMQLSTAPDFDVAAERLAAGEDFATVARELSIDPFVDRTEGSGAGGDLGCSAPSALPGGLAEATLAAPLDEPTGPVNADTGVYLLVVYERTAPELADVRNDVVEFAVVQQGPELFRQWAVEVLQEIDVEVGPEFGVWGMLPETDPVPTVVPAYRQGDIINP
jgi:parvulin-like peptidyl-prolyl isomerase